MVLPAGTQVVTRVAIAGGEDAPARRPGAVGVIVAVPEDALRPYRVRFPDGTEAFLARRELGIRKQRQREDLLHAAREHEDLRRHVIYRCVVGSRAYGLAGPDSDTDRRGIYLPPAERHWSLFGVPEQLEDADAQECYWEIGKFLAMALKANPNILECLYTPLVETVAPLAEELRANRRRFLSQFVYQTYNGYVLSQFKKLEGDLRNKGEIKWKHAMHLIRLLLSGAAILREGHVPVSVGEHRERLLEIRSGVVPWEDVNAWRLALHREFEDAYAGTRLPERPEYAWADAFLIRARRSVA